MLKYDEPRNEFKQSHYEDVEIYGIYSTDVSSELW